MKLKCYKIRGDKNLVRDLLGELSLVGGMSKFLAGEGGDSFSRRNSALFKMCRIWKGKALYIMKKISSQCLRGKDASYANFTEESKIYLSQCYGMTEVISSNNRFYQKDSELSLVLYSKLKSSL